MQCGRKKINDRGRIRKKHLEKVRLDIAKVTQGVGDYNCLYNAIHGTKHYPNGFKVEIFPTDEDKE